MSVTFRRPFFEGTSVLSDQVPEHMQVSIAGHGYIIEPSKYKRTFVTQIRPTQDATDEPGEQTINPEATWRRSRSHWRSGAGQRYLDASTSVPSRYSRSKGVDPWSDHGITLLPGVGQLLDATDVAKVVTGASGEGIYVGRLNENDVQFATDVSATFTACTGLGADVYDIATDGANVYVLSGIPGAVKIYRAPVGTTVFSALTAAPSTYVGVGYANGRLFAWKDTGELVEISATGTETNVLTHRLGAEFIWVAVVATPFATLLVGYAGATSEVFKVAVTDATGALDPPIPAMTIIGEQIRSACYENGVAIFGVQRGEGGNVRLATVGSSGDLVLGPTIVVDDTPGPVLALANGGRFVWFGWSNYDDESTGLGRLDLSLFIPSANQFVVSLTPVYASDLLVDGIGDVHSVVRCGTLTLFTVAGQGLFAEGQAPAGSPLTGTLTTGRIRFNLLDFKSFISLDAHWDTLPADGRVQVSTAVDDGTPHGVIDISETGSQGPPGGPAGVGTTIGEWCEVTITLSSLSDGEWPVFRWWVLRAVPTTGASQRIMVPIIMNEEVRAGAGEQRPSVNFDVPAELDFLYGLVASREVFAYQEGTRVDQVYMANLEHDGIIWSFDKGHINGIVTVELRTLE